MCCSLPGTPHADHHDSIVIDLRKIRLLAKG
jgi:hypothetical protein